MTKYPDPMIWEPPPEPPSLLETMKLGHETYEKYCTWLNPAETIVEKESLRYDLPNGQLTDSEILDWLEKNSVKPWETGKEWADRLGLQGSSLREAVARSMGRDD